MTAVPDLSANWRHYLKVGSSASRDYGDPFLRRGSGEAGLVEENARLSRLRSRSSAGASPSELIADSDAIDLATQWLPSLYRAATKTGWPWVSPHITPSDNGEIVFEWWKGDRKVTIYFSPEGVEFIKVWGPRIDVDMESGALESSLAFQSIWSWLGAAEFHDSHIR
jgi:hypothetical protein